MHSSDSGLASFSLLRGKVRWACQYLKCPTHVGKCAAFNSSLQTAATDLFFILHVCKHRRTSHVGYATFDSMREHLKMKRLPKFSSDSHFRTNLSAVQSIGPWYFLNDVFLLHKVKNWILFPLLTREMTVRRRN